MGVELEANWAVTDALQLYLSYAYLDTEIKDDRCFIDGDDTGYSGVLVRRKRGPCALRWLGDQIGQRIDGGVCRARRRTRSRSTRTTRGTRRRAT